MTWFQGIEDESLPRLNRECIKRWKRLNPTWKVVILCNETISEYVPEFFHINKKAKYDRNYPAKADLLRLLILNKFGGIWADSSLYPMIPVDSFIADILNHTGFFTYRFMNRNCERETVTWFLLTNSNNHYLISRWLEKFTDRFVNGPVNFMRGFEGEKKDPKNYFIPHETLTHLYDTDTKIKSIIDDMVQISERIPHSAQQHWSQRKDSFMYKRPNLSNF